jgi:hypothetical protein
MKPSRLGKIVQDDDLDAARAADYAAAQQGPRFVDRSGDFFYGSATDADLAWAERWIGSKVGTGTGYREIHRLRAIRAEIQRRREGRS